MGWKTLAAVALSAALPAAPPAAATIAYRTTVPRMVEVSDLVFEGRVSGFTPRGGPTQSAGELCPSVDVPYTDVTFEVRQVYKGRLSRPRVIVRVFGGVESNGILRETYLPFRKGERMLLFLEMNGEDDFPFPGFHQGIYRLRMSGPNRTMPVLDRPDTPCPSCTAILVDGRDHLVRGFDEKGYIRTWNASQRPEVRVVVGPGQKLVPAEQTPDSVSGVYPAGSRLPEELASPDDLRGQIRAVLEAQGLPAQPPRLGSPKSRLARELKPGAPIVRCGTKALLSDEEEAFEVVPGGEKDHPIEPGPSEKTDHEEKQR